MAPVDPNKARWLKEVRLGGYRSFGPEIQTLRLWREEGQPCQWTLILGDNGTGKSTLLLLLAHIATQQILKAPQIFGSSELGKWALCEYLLHGSHSAVRWSKEQYMSISPLPFPAVCAAGYGAYRVYRSLSKPQELDSFGVAEIDRMNNAIAHLEFDGYGLKEPSEQFKMNALARQMSRTNLDFGVLVSKALPDHPVVELNQSGTKHFADFKVVVHMPSGPTPFEDLGQGYIAQITYLIDFASRMVEAHEDMENPFEGPAICLIDEIDLHMHPKWQRQIIRHLSETFPNTQFIATAHSPLIVQGAEDANLVLLRRPEQPDADGNRFTIIDNDIDYVTGWRLDQLITSDLFGIDSPRSVETAAKIDEQRSLLKSMARSEEEDARLAALNQELDKLPPGDTAEQARAVMELAEKMRQTLDLFDAKKEQ